MTPPPPTPFINITDNEKPAQKPVTTKAVALEYQAGVDAAPRITASGKGHIAEQILTIAFANGVRVREDAPLVEILSAIEVDSVIPVEAFSAVAEILNYVYHANKLYGKPTPRHEADNH